MTLNPVVYFPLELKSRDLDPRILVAAYCLKAGLSVVLGQQWSILANLTTMPLGCVFFKSVNAISAKALQRSKQTGHIVAASDEEALARRTSEFLPHAVSEGALAACDAFFAQNDLQADALRARFPQYGPRIQTTGNARHELLKLKSIDSDQREVEAIQSKYGAFILFNTNFTHTNSIWGNQNAVINNLVAAGALDETDAAAVAQINAYIADEVQGQKAMIGLIEWVAVNLPQYRIVIRPHPAENKGAWERYFASVPAVSIIAGQNPLPWIKASKVLIHCNCTTGFEAALMDHPTINLSPNPQGVWQARYIMSEVNRTFSSVEEAAKVLMQGARNEDMAHVAAPVVTALARYVPPFSNAAARIAEGLAELIAGRGVAPGASNAWRDGAVKWEGITRTDVQVEKFSLASKEAHEKICGHSD